ncbi:MAG: M1 family peptidase, partial [Deltaproteobacteria bacterium]
MNDAPHGRRRCACARPGARDADATRSCQADGPGGPLGPRRHPRAVGASPPRARARGARLLRRRDRGRGLPRVRRDHDPRRVHAPARARGPRGSRRGGARDEAPPRAGSHHPALAADPRRGGGPPGHPHAHPPLRARDLGRALRRGGAPRALRLELALRDRRDRQRRRSAQARPAAVPPRGRAPRDRPGAHPRRRGRAERHPFGAVGRLPRRRPAGDLRPRVPRRGALHPQQPRRRHRAPRGARVSRRAGRAALVALALAVALAPQGGAGAKPFTDLQRLPAVHRPRAVDLIATRFDVRLDFEARAVSGTSTLEVAGLPRPARVLEVDAVAMEIQGVTDAETGVPLRYDYDGEVVAIPLEPALVEGQRRAVAIAYRTVPKAGLVFVRESPRRPRGHREAWTQGEEEDTRHWLPCIDRLDDFGLTEATVTVPRGLKVLGNGKLVSHETVDGGERWRWRQDAPQATYLTFLAAGPFEVLDHEWRGLPVSFWVLPWQRAQAAERLASTFAALDFFADVLGLAFPWDKYAQVAVSDYPYGGMENTSATLLTADALHGADAEPSDDLAELVVHELAHQWFGDLVTCRSWGHAWLNEGFASYAEALFFAHRDGADEGVARLLGGLVAVAEEQRDYARPLVTEAYDRPEDMFDAHSYSKGAWVLHALRGWLDDDTTFFRGLREWAVRHAHQPVESDQLRRVFEDVSGRDLGRFFAQWLDRPGLPEVEVTLDYEREAGALTLSVRQAQQTPDGVPVYVLPLDVRLVADDGTATARRLWLDAAEQHFTLPVTERPAFVEVDPRGWTPGTVRVIYGREDGLAALAHGSAALSRRRAILALAEMRGDQGVAEALARQGVRDHWGVAQDAIDAIADLDVEDPTALLLGFAEHPASRARAALAKA